MNLITSPPPTLVWLTRNKLGKTMLPCSISFNSSFLLKIRFLNLSIPRVSAFLTSPKQSANQLAASQHCLVLKT